ncbi:MAG: hypothetical protein ACRC30_08115 [Clostridium sp.]
MKRKRSLKESVELFIFSSTFKAPLKKKIKAFIFLLGLTLFARINCLIFKNQNMISVMILSGIIYCCIVIFVNCFIDLI